MIRSAKKTDISQIIPLVMTILKDMELPFLDIAVATDINQILADAIADEEYRYSYRRALVYEENNEILGVAYSYSASDEEFMDAPIDDIMTRYGYEGHKLFTDKEALPDEWYLDTISTKPEARGKGVGSALIDTVAKYAVDSGYQNLGLNVDVANHKARKLYERLGFKPVKKLVISQHHYEHMQKELK